MKLKIGSAVAFACFVLWSPLAAQAATICHVGNIQTAPPGGWGGESTCDCSNIHGSVYASTNWFAWLTSSGSSGGQAWLQIEWQLISGGGAQWSWAEATAGGFYFVNAGGGRNDQIANNWPDYFWTGRYRVVCAQ